uniref:Major facilitator superfamily (MFS) profile domain-containing protein n=2 Tax=Photinus pyralis TaxID=7054 RepID=A0A1Y1MFS3_PHOPY
MGAVWCNSWQFLLVRSQHPSLTTLNHVPTSASLGGFSAGAQLAWLSPAVPQLLLNTSYIGPITIEQASYFSVITPVATIASSFFVANATKVFGRKLVIGFMAIPHIASWLLIATAKSIVSLYVARAVNGISDAVNFCAISVYVGEIATPTVRGRWGNIPMCAILLGHLSVVIVANYCDLVTTAYIFLFAPLLQLLLIATVPESPYLLLMKGRTLDAKLALEELRWKTDALEELYDLRRDVQRQISEPGTFRDLFRTPTNRRALIFIIAIITCQEYSGMSAFIVYSQRIFELAGVKSLSPGESSMIFFAFLFSFSAIASLFVGRYPRRIMLTFSSFGCTISLLISTAFFYIQSETSVDVGQLNWVPLFGMVSYIVFLTTGLSLLPFLMIGELFSASIKNHAMFVANSYMALTMIIVPKLLQLLLAHFPLYAPFLLFTFFSLASTVFCYFFVPETKGKTLEEIQRLLGTHGRAQEERLINDSRNEHLPTVD